MEEIYLKYSRLVYSYLFRLTNDIEISEELTQETFYSAIKGIKNLKKECSVSTWLCQIAKNKWKDFLVKNKKYKLEPITQDTESLFSENNFEEIITSKDELIELYAKIHNLNINAREVFYLKISGEFTFKEIAKIIGRSEEWARITFYRGKLKLKEEMKNEK